MVIDCRFVFLRLRGHIAIWCWSHTDVSTYFDMVTDGASVDYHRLLGSIINNWENLWQLRVCSLVLVHWLLFIAP